MKRTLIAASMVLLAVETAYARKKPAPTPTATIGTVSRPCVDTNLINNQDNVIARGSGAASGLIYLSNPETYFIPYRLDFIVNNETIASFNLPADGVLNQVVPFSLSGNWQINLMPQDRLGRNGLVCESVLVTQ